MAESFQPKFADLVRIYTTTKGTGHFAVGAALTGYRSFHSALNIGDRFYYCAIHTDRPSEVEIGRGTLRADSSIGREPITGSLVNFSSGTKTIALVAAAEWFETAARPANFTAAAPAAVARGLSDKLGDTISVKDFGAVGDGAANDTAAFVAAFQHGLTSSRPVFVPAGTFMVDAGQIDSTTAAVTATRFVMFGEGATSIIKIRDGQITASDKTVFRIRTTSAMELIEFRDLAIDNNARGSEAAWLAAGGGFAFQQAHTFQIYPSTGLYKQVRFRNIVIKDPAADGFNLGGTPNACAAYTVANCVEIDRTRPRSSIQMSVPPDRLVVDGFNGTVIETEAVGSSTQLKSFHLSNCAIERIDLSGEYGSAADNLSGCYQAFLSNVSTTVATDFGDMKVHATNCRLRLSSSGRFNNLAAGSRFVGCTILHPWTGGTPGSIVSLWPFWSAGRKLDLTFDACSFEIDSSDPTIAPTGAMVYPQTTASPGDLGDQRLTISNCRFDPRCEISVNAYRAGTVRLFDNIYGGTSAAVRGGVSSGRAVDLLVDGGDFSRVTGAAFSGGWMDVDQVTTIARYRLTGDWAGVSTPLANWSSTPTVARNNTIISNRRMALTAPPASGLIGDIVDIQQPAEGKPDSYRCTVSSATAAAWRMRSQAGVARGATANRPAGLTASDNGCRYLDTTIAANGKPITWSATQWIDSTGAAA